MKGKRRQSIEADQESKNNQETVEPPPQKRQKRKSLGNSTVTKNKSLCIICNRSKYKGTTDVFRICENERAQSFSDATKYLDEVYTRRSTLNTIQDVFASDVYCHKLCINNYLLKYKRSKSTDENSKNIKKKCKIQKSLDTIISDINRTENGYSLSEIRERVNALLSVDFLIKNRKVKQLLIEKYGNDICFTYPRDRTKSQIFYFRLTPSESFLETIRSKSIYKECANALKEECLSFNFEPSNTFCDANDLDKSYAYLENNVL